MKAMAGASAGAKVNNAEPQRVKFNLSETLKSSGSASSHHTVAKDDEEREATLRAAPQRQQKRNNKAAALPSMEEVFEGEVTELRALSREIKQREAQLGGEHQRQAIPGGEVSPRTRILR